jgi:UDP-N-acetylglucosamine 2-epimerase (non-hydrolysing)
LTKHIVHVVGARPNFVKLGPVFRAIETRGCIRQSVVHTGQHYDSSLSATFFSQLELPAPVVNLAVGSGSHAYQTAQAMMGLEKHFVLMKPDMVIVYGDVNSTVAAALTAAKVGIPVAHVEAGLRSFDRSMPEETNRVVADHLSNLLFAPGKDAEANLLREGIDPKSIHVVGNVMIDSLIRCLPHCSAERVLSQLDLSLDTRYVLVTLHRPDTVDEPSTLRRLLEDLDELTDDCHVIFPVHPRTNGRLSRKATSNPRLVFIDPLSYYDFVGLQRGARLVITDSGGVQEETTFLGVSCLTLRANTERPITVTVGTNTVIGRDLGRLLGEARRMLREPQPLRGIPDLWDGHTGERVSNILHQRLGDSCS